MSVKWSSVGFILLPPPLAFFEFAHDRVVCPRYSLPSAQCAKVYGWSL